MRHLWPFWPHNFLSASTLTSASVFLALLTVTTASVYRTRSLYSSPYSELKTRTAVSGDWILAKRLSFQARRERPHRSAWRQQLQQ